MSGEPFELAFDEDHENYLIKYLIDKLCGQYQERINELHSDNAFLRNVIEGKENKND